MKLALCQAGYKSDGGLYFCAGSAIGRAGGEEVERGLPTPPQTIIAFVAVSFTPALSRSIRSMSH